MDGAAPPIQSPIAVLDSGLGGLTVARALRRLLPLEDVLYFGDTARVPYGSKSPETVRGFVREIISYLRPTRPKHVVIACNTATALALPGLRDEFGDIAISGVIAPGARAAVEAGGKRVSPLIGVIATEATVKSKAYERAIGRRRQHARMVTRATPLLVPMIEEGRGMECPVVRTALWQYLRPMAELKIDVLVLGCTHYPVYRELIEQLLGPGVAVIDSAQKCAEDVRRRLADAGLLKESGVAGKLRCLVTDDPARFEALSGRLLGVKPDAVELVSLEKSLEEQAAPVVSIREVMRALADEERELKEAV